MMIIFFDHKTVIYQHALPSKTTVNDKYYVLVLKNLHQDRSRKHHELAKNWTLYHDNDRLHIATSFQQYLSKYNINNHVTFPWQSRSHIMQFSDCFQCWKSSESENSDFDEFQFWSYFTREGFFKETPSRKRFLYMFWKMGWTKELLNVIWKVHWKRMIYFFLQTHFFIFLMISFSILMKPFLFFQFGGITKGQSILNCYYVSKR